MADGSSRLMPVVGGTKHGEVLTVPLDRWQVMYYEPREMPMVTYSAAETSITEPQMPRPHVLNVQRFCCIMPGRTDRQMFPLLVLGQANEALAWHAILIAWKNGWSPPDSTSEFQPHPMDGVLAAVERGDPIVMTTSEERFALLGYYPFANETVTVGRFTYVVVAGPEGTDWAILTRLEDADD